MSKKWIGLIFVFFMIQGLLFAQGEILWDLTHGVYDEVPFGKYEPAERYSDLTALLAGAGYNMNTTDQGLDNIDLSPYDIIVICNSSSWFSAYTPSEVAAIVAFVLDGGGLFIMGENTMSPNDYINPVAMEFGVMTGVSNPWTLPVTEVVVDNLAPHPIFAGCSEILTRAAGEIDTIPPAEPIAWFPQGEQAFSETITPGGCVITVGDGSWLTNEDVYSLDNATCAVNIFDYLMVCQGEPPAPCPPLVVPLIAGKHITAGEIIVTTDSQTLYITYKCIDGWMMTEAHLCVGDDLWEDFPLTKKGNPKVGRFPYKMGFDPPVTEYTFAVPMDPDWKPGDIILIGAHAALIKEIDVDIYQEETGWGEGTQFPWHNWAMYFEYEICIPQLPPPPPPE
jgi:hypothetical protein